MEAQHECKFSEFQPQVPQLHQQTFLDIIEQVKLGIADLTPLNFHPQTLMFLCHEFDHLLHALEVLREVDLYLIERGSVVLVAFEKSNQLRNQLTLLGLFYLGDLNGCLVGHHISKRVDSEVRV